MTGAGVWQDVREDHLPVRYLLFSNPEERLEHRSKERLVICIARLRWCRTERAADDVHRWDLSNRADLHHKAATRIYRTFQRRI